MGLENGHERGVCSNAVSGAVEAVLFWMLGRSFFGTLEAVLGHAEAGRAPLLHEKMHAPVCALFLSFPPPNRGCKL